MSAGVRTAGTFSLQLLPLGSDKAIISSISSACHRVRAYTSAKLVQDVTSPAHPNSQNICRNLNRKIPDAFNLGIFLLESWNPVEDKTGESR